MSRDNRMIRRGKIAVLAVYLLFGFLIYSNSLNASFHFDGLEFIRNEAGAWSFNKLPDLCSGVRMTRCLTFFTLAANYAAGGYNVLGYHIVNILIHVINAFLVFGIFLILLGLVREEEGESKEGFFAAVFAGFLFLCHPLQTEAVTYIWQRAASLATLFYLLTFLFYLLGRLTGRILFLICAVASFLLGLLSKEIIFTAPLTLFAAEIYFLRVRQTKTPKKARILFLTLFFSAMLILPLKTILTGELKWFYMKKHWYVGAWSATGIQYLLTQCHVILVYLKLLFFPFHQNFDYDIAKSTSLFEVPVAAGLIALALSAFVIFRSFKHHRIFSFGWAWFFITLSVESTFIPLRDVIFEHRLYLPMAGFSLAMAYWGFLWARKAKLLPRIVFPVLIFALGFLTFQRNRVWANEITLWSDVIAKSPHKSRGYTNLGIAYLNEGDPNQAMVYLKKALLLDDRDPLTYLNMGVANMRRGWGAKLLFFRKAYELEPTLYEARLNAGAFLSQKGRYRQALAQYRKLISINPRFAQGYVNMGQLYFKMGNYPSAEQSYRKALEVNPDNPEIFELLGNAEAAMGKLEDAEKSYREALSAGYASADLLTNMAFLANRQEDYASALKYAGEALELNSDQFQAYNQRGIAQARSGDFGGAEATFQTMIDKWPNRDTPYLNFAQLYQDKGKLSEAIEYLERAIALNPSNKWAADDLAALYKKTGRTQKTAGPEQEAVTEK